YVKDIAGFRIAFEIDQVNDAFRVHGGLRLNAVVGRAQQTDSWRAFVRSGDRNEKDHQYERISQNELGLSGIFHFANCHSVYHQSATGSRSFAPVARMTNSRWPMALWSSEIIWM